MSQASTLKALFAWLVAAAYDRYQYAPGSPA